MGGRERVEVSVPLRRLQERLSGWRKDRVKGERIPQPLWKAAARLAATEGLWQTARVLKLDYYSLRKHCQQQAIDSSPAEAFIELPSTPHSQAGECVIEFHSPSGHGLRVHLKGTSNPDLEAVGRLGRGFWGID